MSHETSDSIGMLRALARSAATGEAITGDDVMRALAGLASAPTRTRFESLLDRLARELDGVDGGSPLTRKRVFHAARGLAGWLAAEELESAPSLRLRRCGVERRPAEPTPEESEEVVALTACAVRGP